MGCWQGRFCAWPVCSCSQQSGFPDLDPQMSNNGRVPACRRRSLAWAEHSCQCMWNFLPLLANVCISHLPLSRAWWWCVITLIAWLMFRSTGCCWGVRPRVLNKRHWRHSCGSCGPEAAREKKHLCMITKWGLFWGWSKLLWQDGRDVDVFVLNIHPVFSAFLRYLHHIGAPAYQVQATFSSRERGCRVPRYVPLPCACWFAQAPLILPIFLQLFFFFFPQNYFCWVTSPLKG